MKVRVPTNGSVAILNASAENGSLSSAWRSASFSSSSMPLIAGTSTGEGRKSTTASRTACTPLFLNALPQVASTISLLRVRVRRPCLISASVSSPSSRYLSISSSEASAAASTSSVRYSSAISCMSAGMSSYVKVMPWSASFQLIAFILIRSTTPWKFSSAPMFSWIGTGVAPRRSLICSITRKKSAPVRSILLTKTIRGTWYLSAWRQTVSDWGSTPDEPQNTTTAPSSTRRERSTSIVKSTCPGVSMMLIRWSGNCASIPRQNVVVAAEVSVIPRSCSCSIQSMVAAPSWTSPILWERPV